MKIIQFIETGGAGGAERVVVELSRALKKQGVGVIVVTLRSGWLTESLDNEGIDRRLISSCKGFDFRLIYRLFRLFRDENIDLVHSHLLDSNFYCAIAAKLARIPHLATEHGDVHHIKPKRFMRLKLKIISVLRSRFAAVSEFTANRLVECGVLKSLISVEPNPLTELKIGLGTNREDLRNRFGVSNRDEWIWISVANLRAVKDQATLIRGFAISCKNNCKQQKLWIVGDGEERGNLQDLAEQEGVSDSVIFWGFRDDVASLLAASDGFVLSSVSEALPMSLLEAGAMGLVLVCSRAGGMPEIVKDNKGYCFNVGNYSELGNIMSSVVLNRDDSRKLGCNARDYIVNTFSTDKVVNRYCEIYKLLSNNCA